MHELLFAFVQNYGYLNNMKKNIKDPTLIEADGLHRFVPYLLNRITHRYNKMQQADLKHVGLTSIKMRSLTSLAVYNKLTINELCVHAIAEQPTMSRTIDALEAEGLVARQVSTDDQRVRQVCLTEKGLDVFRASWPVMNQTSDTLSEVLTEDEKRIFQDILMRILDNIRVNPY
tara:strand:- start:154 stop:675 length:522 start_codon:yes stop_codon:yes gene_type:complete